MVKNGFELIRAQKIKEINTSARLFRHILTNAKLLSLENNDENKVFGITFRTPPEDSTGVAHIMEHCVLCGSRKYPVKEPFVELMKGSLNTFLNAFTYPDKTCYPVASQNLKDFYNLIDVYVDAVFHPLITEYNFKQEGWRYDLENPTAPLTYTGIVFNEMKGAYSDPDNILYRTSLQSLFPDNPYGVDSGGDPSVIPNLTYEQFLDFHRTYYHPSNSYIFFYGNDDPEERLRLMDNYLKEFKAKRIDSSIALQPLLNRPQKMEIAFDPGEEINHKKGMYVVNWLLVEGTAPETQLALSILAHILVGTPASPLRKALIDSGWGEDLAGAELDAEIRQPYFSIGLKGLDIDDNGNPVYGENVEHLIKQTLKRLVEEGIDPDTIAASLNTTEFQLRENNTGSYPQGLILMLRSLTNWLYDRDPLLPLAFEAPLMQIKERIAKGEPYFEGLIQNLFLKNHHQTWVIMKPERGIHQKVAEEEKERLIKIRNGLDHQALRAIIDDNHKLKQIQKTPDSPEALASIPSLRREDIDKENVKIPIEVIKENLCPIVYHNIFTNGIVYLDIGFDMHVLNSELLPYISLFGRALTEIGTETQDFVKLSQWIGRSTGGIHTTNLVSSVLNQKTSTAWLFLRGKATIDNAAEMLAILQDILLWVKLDNKERFLQMALEEKATIEANLIPSGHQVVHTRLKAQFSESGWVGEVIGGISYLFFLRELIQSIQNEWEQVLNKLEALRNLLLNKQTMLVNVTLDGKNWCRFRPMLEDFLASLPSEPTILKHWDIEKLPLYQGLSIPAQVNFVGKGIDLNKRDHELDGAINVISNYLRATYLWEKVRVQGGAYGGFCLFDRYSGIFSFLSYRDPNLLSTLEIYDGTVGFLQHLKLHHDELTKSIIGTIGKLDAYLLPDAKGYSSLARYLTRDTNEVRQRLRDQILNTRANDFIRFGDILEGAIQHSSIVVMGAEESIQNVQTKSGLKLRLVKVL